MATRPSIYTPELLKKAEAYLTDYNHYDAQFPSVVGLSLYLGITRKTIYEWNNDDTKPEISDILDKISSIQHEMLVGNGINGTYNAAITKLVLGKHDYHDKQDNNHSGALGLVDLSGKTDAELAAIISGKA